MYILCIVTISIDIILMYIYPRVINGKIIKCSTLSWYQQPLKSPDNFPSLLSFSSLFSLLPPYLLSPLLLSFFTMAANPTLISSDKPFGISQIRAYIPIVLDLDKMNYDVWREMFETHCLMFGVLGHLDGTSVATPDTAKSWKEHDGLVKMWIYGTISGDLTETILKPKSYARELWLA